MYGSLRLVSHILIMSDDNDGMTLLVQIVKDVDDFKTGFCVQITGWFIR